MTTSHHVIAILLILAAAAAVGYHGTSFVQRHLARRREKTAGAIANARSQGFLEGLSHGYASWAAHVKHLHQMDVHGFAEKCRGCGTVTGNIIGADADYWTCEACKHRNPAPVAVGKIRTRTPSEI